MVAPLLYDIQQNCLGTVPIMYVDDLALLMKGSKTEVCTQVLRAINQLKEFARLSGLNLNVDKSKILLKGDINASDLFDTELFNSDQN